MRSKLEEDMSKGQPCCMHWQGWNCSRRSSTLDHAPCLVGKNSHAGPVQASQVMRIASVLAQCCSRFHGSWHASRAHARHRSGAVGLSQSPDLPKLNCTSLVLASFSSLSSKSSGQSVHIKFSCRRDHSLGCYQELS